MNRRRPPPRPSTFNPQPSTFTRPPLPLLILDTNLLVAAAYAPHSASAALLAAVRAGRARWAVSPAAFAEYRHIVPRAVRRPGGVATILETLRRAEPVVPTAAHDAAARGVSEDPDDDKFLALAAAARDAEGVRGGGGPGLVTLLSNDRHLLDVGAYAGVPIARPGAWARAAGF